ncbi:unnamed protein product [Pieris macdunnoughi]|uniref:Uncharacterized protein n=1 Tax=Pieris macdunnoughi TaxID=345717 RepID=A0A821Q793_9NEOP|nr:unnamed protein product [Pieris macdunnoughi]
MLTMTIIVQLLSLTSQARLTTQQVYIVRDPTELTYATQKDESLVPSGIRKVNGLSTHVAFDNFDRFVDTATGKDTLHDTVGIIRPQAHEQKIPVK